MGEGQWQLRWWRQRCEHSGELWMLLSRQVRALDELQLPLLLPMLLCLLLRLLRLLQKLLYITQMLSLLLCLGLLLLLPHRMLE